MILGQACKAYTGNLENPSEGGQSFFLAVSYQRPLLVNRTDRHPGLTHRCHHSWVSSLLFPQAASASHPISEYLLGQTLVGAEDTKISVAAIPFHFQFLKTPKLALI